MSDEPEQYRKQKLHWVDVKEDHNEKKAVQPHNQFIIETVIAEIAILLTPKNEDEHYRGKKWNKSLNDQHQFAKSLWHFKRHDEKRNRECKHRIAESFNSMRVIAPDSEVRIALAEKFFANHSGQ